MLQPTFSTVSALFVLLQRYTAAAQSSDITIWSSVVYARSGEHTTTTNILAEAQLTPWGANQAYNVGNWLHDRYLVQYPIQNLSTLFVDNSQVYVLASDEGQFGPAAAAAILQSLYPPTNSTEGNLVGYMASGIYISNPLGGYQYPWIHTAGMSNSDSIWVNGAEFCPTWETYRTEYIDIADNASVEDGTLSLYELVGKTLGNVEVASAEYRYWNAPAIYEQVNYLYEHDVNAQAKLTSGILQKRDAYNQLRYLSDQYLWGLYGDLQENLDPIRTIAGQSLAFKVLELLRTNVGSVGLQSKLNILVGDYAPLISFFALANLVDVSNDFMGMPQWGSVAMFELYSPANVKPSGPDSDGNIYPYIQDLYVRFVFRNGSSGEVLESAMFESNKPNLTWNEFQTMMGDIVIDDVAGWCGACDAWTTSEFCLFYNNTAVEAVNGLGSPFSGYPAYGSSFSPVVAGVIGACVAFGVLGLLVALAVLLCGLRFSFAKRAPKEGAGGYKGSQKMASDADLTPVKGAAGESLNEQGGKERIGSWELKQKQAAAQGDGMLQPGDAIQAGRPLSFVSSIRRSFDTQDPVQNPFQHPVKPDERV